MPSRSRGAVVRRSWLLPWAPPRTGRAGDHHEAVLVEPPEQVVVQCAGRSTSSLVSPWSGCPVTLRWQRDHRSQRVDELDHPDNRPGARAVRGGDPATGTNLQLTHRGPVHHDLVGPPGCPSPQKLDQAAPERIGQIDPPTLHDVVYPTLDESVEEDPPLHRKDPRPRREQVGDQREVDRAGGVGHAVLRLPLFAPSVLGDRSGAGQHQLRVGDAEPRSIVSARVSPPCPSHRGERQGSTGRTIITRISAVRPRDRPVSRRANRRATRQEPMLPVKRPALTDRCR